MNSDLTPSSEPLLNPTETASDETFLNRQQPIPPPSEPMQYRAIGLVRGRYNASAEQLTQGTLVATDGTQLNAVLLGRIISLLKNHLDLEQEHLWVVYPRIGQQDDNLHLQIVGVWEPDKLSKEVLATQRPMLEAEAPTETNLLNEKSESPQASPEIEDGYFSVRGEIVYQSVLDRHLVVKIKQAPRKESDKPKYFKLKIQGELGIKALGQFWDLQARRRADSLVLQDGKAIAGLPSKPKLRKKPYQGANLSSRRNWDTPSPVRKASASPVPKPILKSPTPKPIKRQKPPQ